MTYGASGGPIEDGRVSLQQRVLTLLDGVALRPRVIYQVLHEASHEAIDAALKGLRQTGRVALVQGRFERPVRISRAQRPLPAPKRPCRAPRTLLGEPLTSREITVATVASEGGTAREIAAALGMSPHTLKGHLSNIYAKLGADGKQDLAERLKEREALR